MYSYSILEGRSKEIEIIWIMRFEMTQSRGFARRLGHFYILSEDDSTIIVLQHEVFLRT